MNEQDLQEFLTEAIETLIDQRMEDRDEAETEEDCKDDSCVVRTFEEAMILTNDKGLVINFNDTEFLVTIVKKY
jgi:hypothetical protein